MVKSNPGCDCGEESVCNETGLQCNPCCRCIPQRLCAILSGYSCDCDGNTTLLHLDTTSGDSPEYPGEIACGGETIHFRVVLHFDPDTQKCYWRLIAEDYYIDAFFEIGPETDQQSCENPQLEVSIPLDHCAATLTVFRHELRIVKPRLNPETCAEEPQCGDCTCTCECLCVTVMYTQGLGRLCRGEICDQSYDDDDLPLWTGSVECGGLSKALTLTLGRDEYSGECYIGGSFGEETLEWNLISDCQSIGSSWTLSDYTVVIVRCKECSCEDAGELCCPDRCTPYVDPAFPGNCTGQPGENPLPYTLSVEIYGNSDDGCFTLSGTIQLIQTYRYAGQLTGSCVWCCENNSYETCTRYFCLSVFLQCGTDGGWFIEFKDCPPAVPPWVTGVPPNTYLSQGSCNPVLAFGDIDCFMAGMICFTPGPAVPPIPPVTHPEFCLSVIVSETL
jgi:hypothetical protein